MRQTVWAFGQSAIPALMPTCVRCHGTWCTELVLSSHSHIPSLESLCLALPSLPALPARGRHHFSHGWHCTALPAPPASKNDKNQGDGAGPGKLHCSSMKKSIPWGKQRWMSWRGDAIPRIQHGPLPLPLPTWCLRQLCKASQTWGWLLPQYPHRTLLGWSGQHHFCGLGVWSPIKHHLS